MYCSEAGVRESGTDHKWCEDRPISRGNWSYNRLERLEDYLTERDLIHLLVETVALGGNLHLDVSPCADGTIPMLQQERLVQMGDWLKVNGEAIYGTRRWTTAHEGPMVESVNPRLDSNWKWTETKQRPLVHYTSKGEAVYAICLAWPGKIADSGKSSDHPTDPGGDAGVSASAEVEPQRNKPDCPDARHISPRASLPKCLGVQAHGAQGNR